MNLLRLLGITSPLSDALKRGAAIIDVRTAQEFDLGHVPDSVHIPVDRIKLNLDRIRAWKKPVIICCDGGSRSAQAVRLLKAAGFKDVVRAGDWKSLLNHIQKF